MPFFARRTEEVHDLVEALKESRELLELAEQSAGIGIWDNDLATDTVRATPTFFRLMGLPVSTEPIASDVVRAVRHPDDASRVRQGFPQPGWLSPWAAVRRPHRLSWEPARSHRFVPPPRSGHVLVPS
jgi:PAS domain-containing protein